MSCSLCNNSVPSPGLCGRCHNRIHRQLDDLLEYWNMAHNELTPGRSGSGSVSSERTIGLNVNALSFIAGHDILGCLHEWEKLIRDHRNLTKPALLEKKPLAEEILDAIKFAQVHLLWSGAQVWISEYSTEIAELHAKGMTAAKAFTNQRSHKIPCPATLPDGDYCGQPLRVLDDPLEIFQCHKCKSEWTTLRMVAVAMSSPGLTQVWLDAEAIGSYLKIDRRSVEQFARRNSIARRGELYDFKAYLAARNA